MPIFEFRCADGHLTEAIVPMNTKSENCIHCGKVAKKIHSVPYFTLSWAPRGYDKDPFKSMGYEGEPGPDYEAKKIQVDLGDKSRPRHTNSSNTMPDGFGE